MLGIKCIKVFTDIKWQIQQTFNLLEGFRWLYQMDQGDFYWSMSERHKGVLLTQINCFTRVSLLSHSLTGFNSYDLLSLIFFHMIGFLLTILTKAIRMLLKDGTNNKVSVPIIVGGIWCACDVLLKKQNRLGIYYTI